MTRPPITTPFPALPRPRLSFKALNLRRALLRLITLSNGLILLALLWTLVDSQAPLGLLSPLFDDMAAMDTGMSVQAIRATLVLGIGFCLVADISQSMRRLPPSYTSLASLSGQCLLGLITVAYVVVGRLPLLALYGIGGTLLLSATGIVIVVQSYAPTSRHPPVRTLLYPILSLGMLVLGISLILSPDTATRQIIELEYGPFVLGGLLFVLAWGSGQLRQNHLTPDRMIKRLLGLIVFPVFSLRLLAIGQPVSILGVVLTIIVAGLAVALAFVQAEIERVEAEGKRAEADRVAREQTPAAEATS